MSAESAALITARDRRRRPLLLAAADAAHFTTQRQFSGHFERIESVGGERRGIVGISHRAAAAVHEFVRRLVKELDLIE